MKIKHLLTVCILMILVQIFIPAKMVWHSESTVISGTSYKFKTMPIDPSDPFRGAYITLNYEVNHVYTVDTTYSIGQKIYVYIKNDKNGFAKVSEISRQPLDNETDFVIAKTTYFFRGKLSFRLPFDRFYMKENNAKNAEISYRKAFNNSLSNNVYALVHIKGENAVLQNVFINEVPIQEYKEKMIDTK